MADTKNMAQEVLGRMKEAYKVRTNAEFSSKTGVPQPTISNWVSRGSIPFRYIYECSQATGVDVDWLSKGGLANARFDRSKVAKANYSGSVYKKLLSSGGQPVLQRILMAYGFTMQKQLGDLLDISSGTMSTWIRRGYFPGDVIVACALDTNTSLQWLATGEGNPGDNSQKTTVVSSFLREIPFYKLEDGQMIADGATYIDSRIFHDSAKSLALITNGVNSWYADLSSDRVGNGSFLLNIDDYIDIYDVTRLPGNKIKVSQESTSFECSIDDVSCVGLVTTTLITA